MRKFRFGVQSYKATSPDDWREQARNAEAMGYSSFHLADHVIGPGPALAATNHPVQDVASIPAMAVAAEATDTIKIGCRVFCIDYRNPVMLAKELATLDWFSRRPPGDRHRRRLAAGRVRGDRRRRSTRPAAASIGWSRRLRCCGPASATARSTSPATTSTPSGSRVCPSPSSVRRPRS